MPGVARGALREQLIAIAFAHVADDGKQEKMEFLTTSPVTSSAAVSRVIVEAFTALQVQLNRERVAMQRQWKQREKQIERVLCTTAGMHGEVRGILGGNLPLIAALELEGGVAGTIEDLSE